MFRNWKCQQAKNQLDHMRLYQWENHMHNLSKQYISPYNGKWIKFLRAFIHWILKQKIIYEDRRKWVWGYHNRYSLWTFAHYTNIRGGKIKFLKLFSSSKSKFFLFDYSDRFYNFSTKKQHYYRYSNIVWNLLKQDKCTTWNNIIQP